MVVLCQFFPCTSLHGVVCNFSGGKYYFGRLVDVGRAGGWRLVCCGVFGDGYYPQSCGGAFFATYYLFATVCDVASNHCEFYCAASITEFGD